MRRRSAGTPGRSAHATSPDLATPVASGFHGRRPSDGFRHADADAESRRQGRRGYVECDVL
jgi:hypothetical protein